MARKMLGLCSSNVQGRCCQACAWETVAVWTETIAYLGHPLHPFCMLLSFQRREPSVDQQTKLVAFGQRPRPLCQKHLWQIEKRKTFYLHLVLQATTIVLRLGTKRRIKVRMKSASVSLQCPIEVRAIWAEWMGGTGRDQSGTLASSGGAP